MPVHLLQPTLNGGVAAPGLWHRIDQQKFSTWLRECVNFYVQPQGGVANRPGTLMLAPVKTFAYTYEEEVNLYAWGVSGYESRTLYTETPTPSVGSPVYLTTETTASTTVSITAVDLTSNPPTIDYANSAIPSTGTLLRQPSWDTTRTVTKTGYKSKKTRLLPFVFSKTQAYALEVGDGYIQFVQSKTLTRKNHVAYSKSIL